MQLEVITIGDELLNGTVVDTNSAWIGRRVAELGGLVRRRQVVADRIDDIVAAMRLATGQVPLVITSGGLGPTLDDLTAEAFATFLAGPLALSDEALAQVGAWREERGRPLREIDKKQALMPPGASVLHNTVGTAPAFSIEHGGTTFLALPGVPRELKTLFGLYVEPRVKAGVERVPLTRTWKFYGVTESGLADAVAGLDTTGHELHYRAHFPEIHLTSVAREQADMDRLHAQLMGAASHRYFGTGDADFAGTVNDTLRAGGFTVATAESCTGGLVAQMITSAPGSSEVFNLGWVTYANAAKMSQLGVAAELLEAHGAVSQEVAMAMAAGARERAGATFGVATSGVAGPGGGSDGKPVGTVHVAVATPDQVHHRRFQFPFDRERNRVVTAYTALALVRKYALARVSGRS